MSRFFVAVAAVVALSACGNGNPFTEGTDPENPIEPAPTIPADLAGDVDSISYDAVNKTLVVRGESLDNTPYEAVYQRRPALDRAGYEAYTSQESSLGRHHTAYVLERDGAQAAIVMAGGQFGHVYYGSGYNRSGTYTPPDVTQPGGIVQYAGSYVALLNGPGDGGDLLPVTPGTPVEVRPSQAEELTGTIFIAADFADNVVDGVVYNRVALDDPLTAIEDLELSDGVIAGDGTFTGEVQQDRGTRTVGVFGGNFGGTGASAVAGTLYADDHIAAYDNEFEIGLFVLAQCGTANADPICNQPSP